MDMRTCFSCISIQSMRNIKNCVLFSFSFLTSVLFQITVPNNITLQASGIVNHGEKLEKGPRKRKHESQVGIDGLKTIIHIGTSMNSHCGQGVSSCSSCIWKQIFSVV